MKRSFSEFNDYDEYQEYLKERRRESSRVSTNKRIELEKLLQSELNSNTKYRVLEKYGNKCLLTGDKDKVEIDHFIPLSWGRVGSVWGNLYPLSKKVNSDMRFKNPFVWIWGDSFKCPDIDWIKWKEFIELVAKENQLTVDELVDFTYWCEEHKRTVAKIMADEEKSIDIWRKGLNGKKIPRYNFFSIRIRQEELKENKIYWEFKRSHINEYWDKYHPVYQKMKKIGKIKFRRKGKYSTEFERFTIFGRYLCTKENDNGIEIEEWSKVSDISIDNILNYLQTTENQFGRIFNKNK